MNREVDLGRQLWLSMADDLRAIVRAEGAITREELARVWAGFLSAAAGAMAADIGKADADTVLAGVAQAMRMALRDG